MRYWAAARAISGNSTISEGNIHVSMSQKVQPMVDFWEHTALADQREQYHHSNSPIQGDPPTYTLHGVYVLKDSDSRPKAGYRRIRQCLTPQETWTSSNQL